MAREWCQPQGREVQASPLIDRQDEDGRMPFNQPIDRETGLFPLELDQCDSLYRSCREYMDEADLALVCRSMVFALQAHGKQYRYKGEPYSIHPLATASDLVAKKLDAITISGALLHDVMEDTPIEYAQIKEAVCADNQTVSAELEDTLNGVSNLRSRHMRKGLRDEEYRKQIVQSIFRNPRIALIKIADRKHNLNTLDAVPSPYKRAQTCRETQLVYIPLARVLGLAEEADELGELTLKNQSGKHRKILERIEAEKYILEEDLSPRRVSLTELHEDILKRVSIYDCCVLSTQYPSTYTIFEEMRGKLREPTKKDVVIKTSIALQGSSKDPLGWAQRAVSIKTVFAFAFEYELVDGLTDDKKFRADCEKGQVNNLTFRMRRKSDNLYIDISVYPADAYFEKETPISDLYYLQVTESSVGTSETSESAAEIGRRHDLACQKMQGIIARHRRLQTTHSGEVPAQQMVLFLEETIPRDKIIVTGIDNLGQEEPWITEAGSTVMDYIREIRSRDWFCATAAWVNGNPVDFNYQLQPGDKVHVDLGEKANWDPWWMYCFNNDERGSFIVKRHVKELLGSRKPEVSQAMKSKLYEAGIKIIERSLPADNQPLRVGVDAALDLIREHDPKITAKDFLIKTALGEVNPQLLQQVVISVGEYNRQVFVVRLEFSENRTGQTQRVMEVINGLDIGYSSFEGGSLTESEGPIWMLLYFSPRDKGKREAIIEALQQDPRCKELTLVSVS